MENTLQHLEEALATAKSAGADAADASLVINRSTSVKCRLGQLEQTGRSENASLSLRVFVGQKTARLTSSDISRDAVSSLIDQAVIIAKNAPEDPHAGLLETAEFATERTGDLDLFDAAQIGAEALFEAAKEIEQAALEVENVEQVAGASAAAGDVLVATATSNGFLGQLKRSSFSRFCGAVASDDSGKEVGYEQSGGPHLGDLLSPSEIGRIAGERAASKLGAVKITTGRFPVVFAPEQAHTLVNALIAGVSGPNVAMGMSFLKDCKNTQAFTKGINIYDDPTRRRGLGSRLFDGEGAASQKMALVSDGVLQGWLHNRSSANELGDPLTGHARSMGAGVSISNVFMEPGVPTPDELVSDIGFGFYVTDLLGHGPNNVTGDYSMGAKGFAIRDGQIAEPVKEVTIAGNLKDMFQTLMPANDLVFKRQINAPTVRVEGMMVAGE